MGTFWCLQPLLRNWGSKNLKNHHPPPLILGIYCPDCAVQGRLLILSSDKYFKRISTQVKTFLRPLAPDKLFPKTDFFFQNISKTVRDNEKRYGMEFLDLLINNYLLAGHILIFLTVIEILGSKKS